METLKYPAGIKNIGHSWLNPWPWHWICFLFLTACHLNTKRVWQSGRHMCFSISNMSWLHEHLYFLVSLVFSWLDLRPSVWMARDCRFHVWIVELAIILLFQTFTIVSPVTFLRPMKVAWRSLWAACGGQCVIATGTTKTRLFSAGTKATMTVTPSRTALARWARGPFGWVVWGVRAQRAACTSVPTQALSSWRTAIPTTDAGATHLMPTSLV